MLQATIGYGFLPLRALWSILAFVVLGTVLFQWATWSGWSVRTEEAAYESSCAAEPLRPATPL